MSTQYAFEKLRQAGLDPISIDSAGNVVLADGATQADYDQADAILGPILLYDTWDEDVQLIRESFYTKTLSTRAKAFLRMSEAEIISWVDARLAAGEQREILVGIVEVLVLLRDLVAPERVMQERIDNA